MKNIFRGTGVALVTPFNNNGEIDFESLSKLVDHCIYGGVDFLVALGTTSESATLSDSERNAVLSHIVEINDNRLPILMGVGGNNTSLICSNINSIPKDIKGLLCVSPYYNKPTQEGIYQHFKEISISTNLPIVLYNVPGRTASNMTALTTLSLAKKFDNIVAIKEASGDLEQVMQIIKDAPDGFDILSGDDNLTFSMISLGAAGVISVSGQSFPNEFSLMVNHLLNGDLSLARSIHFRLFNYMKLIFREGNPGGVKWALSHMEIISDKLRLPLWEISDELKRLIEKEVDEIRKNSN
jgi:4-hydroxy-tetrahydrodipicolinate synthase